MGLLGVKTLCGKLIEHGLSAETPIALVQKATTRQQKVVVGTLKTMPDLIEKTKVKPPTLIIVGDVVKLHEKLSWFGSAKTVGED
jgi:uroporphyrin-III C-methyltransferase/precorrin-2 dehydrogenase/sirohydrochlorin ferrochelatase